MAENWIAIDHTTPRKPEIVSLAMTLGISKREATGLMVDVWIWADQNTYDGGTNCNGVSVTCALLDITFDVTGLADALFSVGWLEIAEDGSIAFPNFGDNNGKTAKTRKQVNRRVSKHRDKKVKRKCNAGSVTKSLPQEQEQEQDIYTPGDSVKIPDSVNTPEVIKAVGTWIAYLGTTDVAKSIESNSPQEQALWSMLTSWRVPPDEIVDVVNTAIASSWLNLRKPDNGKAEKKPNDPTAIFDDLAAAEADFMGGNNPKYRKQQ